VVVVVVVVVAAATALRRWRPSECAANKRSCVARRSGMQCLLRRRRVILVPLSARRYSVPLSMVVPLLVPVLVPMPVVAAAAVVVSSFRLAFQLLSPVRLSPLPLSSRRRSKWKKMLRCVRRVLSGSDWRRRCGVARPRRGQARLRRRRRHLLVVVP
jgi:hypothetical protein